MAAPAPSVHKAVIDAASACGQLHTTAFADAFRRDGDEGLRRAFSTAMQGPCQVAADAGQGSLRMCRTELHREQICADWFLKQGPCRDALSADYRARNPGLCEATAFIATDYPELQEIMRQQQQ